MGLDNLVVDVTVRHDFTGDARDVRRHGTPRNPDRPDQLLDQAATDKIRNYRFLPGRSSAGSVDRTQSKGQGWVYAAPGCFAHPKSRAFWLGGAARPRAGGHRVSRR